MNSPRNGIRSIAFPPAAPLRSRRRDHVSGRPASTGRQRPYHDRVDWQAVVLTLLSGIAGVVLGAVITLNKQKQEEDRLNQGAARVTYVELAENTDYLKAAIKRATTMPVMTRTWPETRARLAAMLGPSDFAVVATAYGKLTALELPWGMRPIGTTGLGANSLEATRQVLERVEAAASILLSQGWPRPEDREELAAQLAEDDET